MAPLNDAAPSMTKWMTCNLSDIVINPTADFNDKSGVVTFSYKIDVSIEDHSQSSKNLQNQHDHNCNKFWQINHKNNNATIPMPVLHTSTLNESILTKFSTNTK